MKLYYLDGMLLMNAFYSLAPDVPIFADILTGEDSVNASWVPSNKGPEDGNPGAKYKMKYKKSGLLVYSLTAAG